MKRPLTGFEKAFCLSEPQVPMNFCLVARFDETPDVRRIQQALERLGEIYAMAMMRLTYGEDGEARFTNEGVPSFPLIVIESSKTTWQAIAAEELGKNFDLNVGPLIRLILLKATDGHADLILCFHHGISDGMSAVYFLQDLLLLLNDKNAVLASVSDVSDLMERIPPEIGDSFLVKMQCFGMKLGLRIMKFFSRFRIGFPTADRLIDGKLPWDHISLTTHCLSTEQTKVIAAKCNENQTSVHAALCAAWLLARHEIMGNEKSKRKLSIPVNLRKYLQVGKAFGMIMSNAIIAVDCSSEREFWKVARDIKGKLCQEIDRGRVYQWIVLMHLMTDLPHKVIKSAVPVFASQPSGYDFSISNLGRLKLGNAEQVSAIYGPIVNTSEKELTVGISTIHDCLTMSFIYRDFELTQTVAEEITEHVLSILQEVLGME